MVLFGIAIGFIIAGVAAFNLLLDFDNIEQAVAYGAPKYYEYFCAFWFTLNSCMALYRDFKTFTDDYGYVWQ